MKLFGYAMIKNEGDIIESFIRSNMRILDELHIIDDGSNDNTLSIIQNLKEEGFNIAVYFHQIKEIQQQSQLLTMLLNQTKALSWDYAVMLDADEFILGARSEFENDLKILNQNSFGLIDWVTFVPIENDKEIPEPLFSKKFKARKEELVQCSKVVIPKALLNQSFQMGAGNHFVFTSKPWTETHINLKTRLGHVPIRSVPQLIKKTILGSHLLSIKKIGENQKQPTGI